MLFRQIAVLALLLLPTLSFAQEAKTEEVHLSISLVWIALCSAMVFFMQAGFALLESGMIRSKNAINVIMKNYTDVCFGVIAYWLVGYGLMYGSKFMGLIGTNGFMVNFGSSEFFLNMLYNMMFVATAATIVSGAVAERMRYWPYIVGAIFMSAFIYPVFGGWVWGGSEATGYGWLEKRGFVDMAGSTVVHSIGGWAALAAIIVLGPRTGRFSSKGEVREIPGHNLPMVSLGIFILWFGWFGFNGGSAGGNYDNLGRVLLNTQLCASAAALGGLFTMSFTDRGLLMTYTVNCVLGGLVASCAGAATMFPGYAILTGFIAGMIVVMGSELLAKFRIDDVVSAVPVHAFCGVWGTLAAGLFYAGDIFNLERIVVQIMGIAAAFFWSFGLSTIVYIIINEIVGIRASKLHEQRGLDYTEHSEVGYAEFQQDIFKK